MSDLPNFFSWMTQARGITVKGGPGSGRYPKGSGEGDEDRGAAETVDRFVMSSQADRNTMVHKGEIKTDVGGGVTGNFYGVGNKIVAQDTWGTDHAEGVLNKHNALDSRYVIGRSMHVINGRPYLVSEKLDRAETVFDVGKLPKGLQSYISDFESRGGGVGEGKFTYGYDKGGSAKLIDVSEWRLPRK